MTHVIGGGARLARRLPGCFAARSRRRIIRWAAFAIVALVAGSSARALLPAGHNPSRAVREHAERRLAVIQAHLAEAADPFVLIAGDSHAELASPAVRPCGWEVVNAGVSGARVGFYRDVIQALHGSAKPRAIVLMIGTNDIILRGDPLSPAHLAAFGEEAAHLLAALKALTPRLVVTAVPPVDPVAAKRLEAAAVAPYSQQLAALCARLGCRFADPFADLRGEDGFARAGALRDGLHMAHYRTALAKLAPLICDVSGDAE
jgi:hypothetical protein